MSRSACNVRPIQQARLQCATIIIILIHLIIIFQHSHLSQLCVHNQLYFTGSWKYVWQLQLLPLRWLDTHATWFLNTCISVKNCFLVDVNYYLVKFFLRNIFEIKYL